MKLSGLVRYFGIAALFLAAALFGTASGVMFAFVGDLPQISALDDYSPGTITRVLGRDGSVIGDFATERRVLVTYDEIPVVLRNAILASEDATFFKHGGLRIGRILISAAKDIAHWRIVAGGSTITQQLTKKLFLTDDQTPERKIKEALLTVQIEKHFTKEEIFTMYCNKMYFGHYVYGVEAASQLYFGKSVKDLNLDEAALIAGLLQGNVRQSPYVNMRAALSRRGSVLDRMATERFITPAEAEAAKKRPIVTRGEPSPPPSVAPYFLDMVRQQLEDSYGAKAVYENGLVIRTGIDPALQRAANTALDEGLRRLDKERGVYRKPARNLVTEKRPLDTYRVARWTREMSDHDIVPAIVVSVDATDIHVRAGPLTGTIGPAGYKWTRKKAADLVKKGDLIEVDLEKVNRQANTFTAKLDQAPVVEGAVVAIENRTGQILAMVGGQSFQRSQFNRATQAKRQVGSLFKPFVFTAAIDRGYTAQSMLDDLPVSYDVGPGQPRYEPQNYDRLFLDKVSMREALEESRNVPTVGLMSSLGPKEVIGYARRLGVTSPLPEYLSIAIGAAEGTLIEMTSAYSAFPNQGVRMAPLPVLDVTDREGTVLEQHRTEPHEAIRADTAYIMTSLLEGVIQHKGGTGQQAAELNWPLGGKTGTTDDYTDAWFVGFDPEITLGVWVGFDQKRSLGDKKTGAVAALPIWQSVMQSWVERRRKELPEKPDFERPGNIVTVSTDKGPEVFIAGTEPGAK